MALTTELRSFSFRRLSEVLENTEEFATVAAEIVAEFKTVGFLRLEDIPGFIDQELLDEIKWFHSLPFDTKMKISLKRFGGGTSNQYRGYMPLVDGVNVYKEQTDFGNNEFTRDPNTDLCESFMKEENSYPKSQKFQDVIEKFYRLYFEGLFLQKF